MEETIFIVSLVGKKISNGKSIIGYINDNDMCTIVSYIKNKYNINVCERILNEFSYQNEIHWEYKTDYSDVKVHIDMIDKIE